MHVVCALLPHTRTRAALPIAQVLAAVKQRAATSDGVRKRKAAVLAPASSTALVPASSSSISTAATITTTATAAAAMTQEDLQMKLGHAQMDLTLSDPYQVLAPGAK